MWRIRDAAATPPRRIRRVSSASLVGSARRPQALKYAIPQPDEGQAMIKMNRFVAMLLASTMARGPRRA